LFFKDQEIDVGYRQDFIFNEDLFMKRRQKKVINNFLIQRIDTMQLVTKESELLQEDIHECWYSMEDFVEKGVGFFAKVKERIVSACFSCYSSKNGVDINIITYEDEDRGNGYATQVATAMIEYCISNRLQISWEAYDNNLASIALAEKLGFVKSNKYLCYEYLFKE
jgi:RimJ/RimL family protein N-acetyltransferase